MPRCVLTLLLALLVLAASGCRLRVGTEVAVAADGSGELGVVVALDDETAALLEEAGYDPLLGLTDVAATNDGWEIEEVELEQEEAVKIVASFDDPEAFDTLAAGFHDGLDPADGAIFEDLDLDRTSDGRIRFAGRAGLVPPSTPGADGTGLAFDADDLERLLEERADELVRYDLVLSLPAVPIEHDADVVEGRTLTWHLPVGELRPIHAVSAPPRERTPWLLGGLALLAVVVGFIGSLLWRRRRSSAG